MYEIIEIDGQFKIIDVNGVELNLAEARHVISKLSEIYPAKGFVYLIRKTSFADSDAIYKIGATSRDPQIRLRETRTIESIYDYELIHYFEFQTREEAFCSERYLHNYYNVRGMSLGGEWFALDTKEIDFICNLPNNALFLYLEIFYRGLSDGLQSFSHSERQTIKSTLMQTRDEITQWENE